MVRIERSLIRVRPWRIPTYEEAVRECVHPDDRQYVFDSVYASAEGQEFIVSVSDTGIGIAPDDQQKIFEEFYQASGVGYD